MLALWARAARNPGSCRCIPYASTTTGAVKRAGAPSLPGFAAFGTPTSTFIYTAIFAAGLTVDAKAKQRRKEKWDAAIAQLRHEIASESQDLSQLEHSTAKDEAKDHTCCTPIEELLCEDIDWNLIHELSGVELVEEESSAHYHRAFEFVDITDDLWNLLPWDSRLPGAEFPLWPTNTGYNMDRKNMPPQSLWALEFNRLRALRRRHSWKKLAMQELSIAYLIHHLIEKSCMRDQKDEKWFKQPVFRKAPDLKKIVSYNETQLREAKNEIWKKMAQLHRENVELCPNENYNTAIRAAIPAIPHYFQDANGDYHYTCQQMNGHIKKILHNTDEASKFQGRISLLKICYNLLASSAAPDLQTFNTMLAGFKKWHRPYLVDAVIAALDSCKIRLNEITCVAILGHYVTENRADDFSRFVSRMRGVGNALMLAHPDVAINEASQGRLIRENGKVYQLLYPTPMVFNILIGGVLKFAGFERALDIYFEIKAEGWGLDVFGLEHLLNDCIKRADWNGGLYVWQEINSIKHSAKAREMVRVYTAMLSLCSVTGNTTAFNQLLKEIVGRGFDGKSILRSATEVSRKAQKSDNLEAPAWAADNLLIATSSYIEDVAAHRNNSPPPEEGNPMLSETTENQPPTPNDQVAEDPESRWSSWLEHELGEKPEKHSH